MWQIHKFTNPPAFPPPSICEGAVLRKVNALICNSVYKIVNKIWLKWSPCIAPVMHLKVWMHLWPFFLFLKATHKNRHIEVTRSSKHTPKHIQQSLIHPLNNFYHSFGMVYTIGQNWWICNFRIWKLMISISMSL